MTILQKCIFHHLNSIECGRQYKMLGDKKIIKLDDLEKYSFDDITFVTITNYSEMDLLFKDVSDYQIFQTQNKLFVYTNLALPKLMNNLNNVITSITKFRNIISLSLINTRLKDDSIKILKQANLQNIHVANFTNNQFTHVGIKHLIESQWIEMQALYLGNNPLKNRSLQLLAKCFWPNLTHLDLQSTQITDDGVKCLKKAQWPRLKTIILLYNNLGSQALKCLMKSSFSKLGAVSIEYYECDDPLEMEDTMRSKTYINHNLASKYPPSWKQTFVMANYKHVSDSFQQIIRFKNSHLFVDQLQFIQDDD